MRTLVKLAFLLTLAFAGLVGGIRAQPHDDSDLRALLPGAVLYGHSPGRDNL
jgi:hypothetical protein